MQLKAQTAKFALTT